MNKCDKCGKETYHKPLPIYKKGKLVRHIIRCDDCFKKGLMSVMSALAQSLDKEDV